METLLNIFRYANINMEIKSKAIEKTIVPSPDKLIRVIEKLKKNGSEFLRVPDTRSIELLAKKIKNYYDLCGILVDLDRRDIKLLPYVLYHVEDIALGKIIVEKLDKIKSNSILKREITAYLLAQRLTKVLELLRESVLGKLHDYVGRNQVVLRFKEHSYLFYDNASAIVLEKISQEGFFEYFTKVGFNSILLASWFVKAVLIKAFDNSKDVFEQHKLFNEIISNDKYMGIFQNILPNLLGKLIIAIDNNDGASKLKQAIQTIAVNLYGDPRISTNRINKWHSIGAIATNIFINWLSRYDLKLFFTIIDQGLGDSVTAKRMWSYRRAFWSSYVDEISNAWVCYGNSACDLIKRNNLVNMSFGKFADSNKSCIIIQIRDYVFVERSHNGSIKAWHRDLLPQKLYSGVSYVREWDITGQDVDYTWTHGGAESYGWQKKVGRFIADNCGIYRTVKDWC